MAPSGAATPKAAAAGAAALALPTPDSVPAEYREWVGRISDDKTMPQLKKFVESGGSIVTIGSSTSIAEVFGIPVKNHLTEKGPDGRDRAAAAREVLHSRVAAQGARR